MITQTFIGPPPAPVVNNITPLDFFWGGVAMWGFFAIVLAVLSLKGSSLPGLRLIVPMYAFPVIVLLMFATAGQ